MIRGSRNSRFHWPGLVGTKRYLWRIIREAICCRMASLTFSESGPATERRGLSATDVATAVTRPRFRPPSRTGPAPPYRPFYASVSATGAFTEGHHLITVIIFSLADRDQVTASQPAHMMSHTCTQGRGMMGKACRQ